MQDGATVVSFTSRRSLRARCLDIGPEYIPRARPSLHPHQLEVNLPNTAFDTFTVRGQKRCSGAGGRKRTGNRKPSGPDESHDQMKTIRSKQEDKNIIYHNERLKV